MSIEHDPRSVEPIADHIIMDGVILEAAGINAEKTTVTGVLVEEMNPGEAQYLIDEFGCIDGDAFSAPKQRFNSISPHFQTVTGGEV